MRHFSLIFTALAFACVSQVAFATEIVFATLNDNVRKQAKRFARLELYLETELSASGVTDVTLEVFQDAGRLTQALKTGDVDFYFDSPLVAAKIGLPAGAEMFLRRWKRGVGTYHSVIFVSAGSEIKTLEDLRGARVAMQEPTSTSGFLLPISLLIAEGLPLAELPDRDVLPSGSEVGFLFTGDDKNTALWIVKGIVEAGATDNATFAQLDQVSPGQYRIVAQSAEVPRQVVMKRAGIDPAVAASVADVLTTMHQNEDGAEILRKFNKTTQFEVFSDAPDVVVAPLAEILSTLEEIDLSGW